MDKEKIIKFNDLRSVYAFYNNKYLYAVKSIASDLEVMLTPTQLNVLNFLFKQGDATVGELADSQSTTVNYMSIVLKGLMKKGFVKRYQKEENLRYVYYTVSDKGSDYYNKNKENFLRESSKIINRIFDETDLDTMIKNLTSICDILKKFEDHKEIK